MILFYDKYLPASIALPSVSSPRPGILFPEGGGGGGAFALYVERRGV